MINAAFVLAPVLYGASPAFSDQTASAQVIANHQPTYAQSYLAGGTVGDFDGDGRQDIFVATGGGAPDRLFINDGDGTFTDRAAEWNIALAHRSTAGAAADFNGDGRLDLFVTSLGSAAASIPGRHRLYRNDGGTFTDVAIPAGVSQTSVASADGFGAAWGDYDLDGDLDLAVAGWITSDGNRLFRNNFNDGGGETFTDVTASAGLALSGVDGFAPRFADMDGDRYPELIWIGDFGTSQYYRNDGDGSFTDVTAASGTSLDGTEMGITVADIDQDGDFDFYVSTINTNNLYRNNGGNVFTEIAAGAGAAVAGWGWGVVAIDMDHDTKTDLISTTQSGQQYAFRNTSAVITTPTFVNVAAASGLVTSVSGRGLSNFDYDNDGDQDLVFFPHNGPVKLFRNDVSGADAKWLRVLLDRGSHTDIAPNGVGAVVRVSFGPRTLSGRIDGGSNYLSQSEMSAHFGLGSAAIVDEVVVEWPNGDTTVLTGVAVNQTLSITPDPLPCPADLTGDDVVGFADLTELLLDWGPCAACAADITGDGTVGFADLTELLLDWGSCP